jgi:radical SAM superfamily enzyme YgiQ (UPF0313 family)
MGLKRVSFIESASPGLHVFSKYSIARVGTVLLATILRDRGYETRVFIENIASPDWSYLENSDIVCISTLTSTAPRAYEIGKRLKRLGIPVIMGGAHPTFMTEEALEYADFVVRGEGDISLPELIDYIHTGRPAVESIAGISYRDRAGTIHHNPDRELIDNEVLDRFPFPDFSLVHNWRKDLPYPISTSRGCPFQCRFCSVIAIFGRKYRFRSIDSVIGEMQYVKGVSGALRFFVDDNFIANKTRSRELLREMIEQGLSHDWSAQVRTDVARDEELLRLMADSKCHTVHIGFESINPGTLERYNKGQTIDDIRHCVRLVKDHGIHIHGMFVVGADTDDADTIRRTVDFAIENGVDTIQLMVLTPLPGTPFFEEMKRDGRIMHYDWSKYDAHHVVFTPARVNPRTLQIESLREMGRFYSWKYIFRHLSRLNLHYAGIGLFGKMAVKKTLKEAYAYISMCLP